MKNVKDYKRTLYLEYLRIISIIFVIFNHTGVEGFMLFSTKKPDSSLFWLGLFLSIFCKFAVPIFFMISGLLLFKKKYTSKEIMGKVIEMVITLLVFSLIYYLFSIHNEKTSFNILVFIKKLLTCNISIHFWYLYMYIFFLLSYPLLYCIIKNININIMKYLVILVVIMRGIIPVVYYLVYKEPFTLNVFVSPFWCLDTVVVYPCLGYYLGNEFKLQSKKQFIYLWIINIVLLLISCFMTYYLYQVEGGLRDDMSCQIFYNSFVIINAITIFISVKYLFETIHPNKIGLVISSFGKYVFGIYLIHPLMKKLGYYYYIHNFIISHYSSSILLLVVICFYMFFCSLAITMILSEIPYIKKLVGFK